MNKNREGYSDPTAEAAFARVMRAEMAKRMAEEDDAQRRVSAFMRLARDAAELAGLEIRGRITLADLKTGRTYF